MILRELRVEDIPELKTIHAEHHREFAFPDFFDNFLCAYIVTTDDGTPITAGGVRSICEVVAVTNKSIPIAKRQPALYKILDFSKHITSRYGYDELHAISIDNPKWEKHLRNHGFRDSRGKWLVNTIGE